MRPSPFRSWGTPLLVVAVAAVALAGCTTGGERPEPTSSATPSPSASPTPGPSDLWQDPDFGVRDGFVFMHGLCANLPWSEFDDLGEIVAPEHGDRYTPVASIICSRDIRDEEGQEIGYVWFNINFWATEEQAVTHQKTTAARYDADSISLEGWDKAALGSSVSEDESSRSFAFAGHDRKFTLDTAISLKPDAAADHPESKLLDLTRLLATTAHDLSLAD